MVSPVYNETVQQQKLNTVFPIPHSSFVLPQISVIVCYRISVVQICRRSIFVTVALHELLFFV